MQNIVPSVQSSREEIWYTKDISFGYDNRTYKIICQNFNGPCSFIAICNILILRGNLTILPPNRTTASYEFMSQLVAEYLLTECEGVDIDAALSNLPLTQFGMDLNPVFTSPKAFKPGGDGSLQLFDQVGIELLHGWLVDPTSPEGPAVTQAGSDYDTATTLIAEADHLSNGSLVPVRDIPPQLSSPSSAPTPDTLTEEERGKVGTAIILRRYLDTTWSQLTYHGLFALSDYLEPNKPVALFRSSHLSVLFKPGTPLDPFADSDEPPMAGSSSSAAKAPAQPLDTSIYTLVTDQAFLHEPSVVWERLEDVDGGSSSFFDAEFRKSTPVGGDFAGATAQGIVDRDDHMSGWADQELARQLQAVEDENMQRHIARAENRQADRQQLQRNGSSGKEKKQKKKKDCVIM